MLNIFRQDIIHIHAASFTSHLLLQNSRHPAAHFFQLPQAAVLRHRPGTASYQLKAVIGLGIVACCNHDAAVQLKMSSSKINHLRAALTNIHHITACLCQSPYEGFFQGWPGQADIMAYSNTQPGISSAIVIAIATI